MMTDGYWASYEERTQDLLILCLIEIINRYVQSTYNKTPCRISNLSGNAYVEALVNQQHPRRIQEIFRMPLYTFVELQIYLAENTELRSSKAIGIAEKLAMFIETIGRGTTNRGIQERFQHSGATVSRCFHEVLNALLILHTKYVQLPVAPYQVGNRIAGDAKYSPYFGDCLGALDGTHIAMHVPYVDRTPYRSRKGFLSQNVLAACTFDMRFSYVLPGWEGSAHDGRVLSDAISGKGFIVPEGKYYLGDAGYSNSDHLLIPYRQVRYHLKEQLLAVQKPENAKELFNLRHSSLRNAIERIFGITKRRFKILNTAPEYPITTQVHLVYAVTALHNFIRMHPAAETDYFEEMFDGNEGPDLIDQEPQATSFSTSSRMNGIRDAIAGRMWVDYQAYLEKR